MTNPDVQERILAQGFFGRLSMMYPDAVAGVAVRAAMRGGRNRARQDNGRRARSAPAPGSERRAADARPVTGAGRTPC